MLGRWRGGLGFEDAGFFESRRCGAKSHSIGGEGFCMAKRDSSPPPTVGRLREMGVEGVFAICCNASCRHSAPLRGARRLRRRLFSADHPPARVYLFAVRRPCRQPDAGLARHARARHGAYVSYSSQSVGTSSALAMAARVSGVPLRRPASRSLM